MALNRAGVRYAVVGGYAVALHGAVRGTVDIDIAIAWGREALSATEQALKGMGLASRLPVTADEVFKSRREYVENHNLAAWNFYNPNDLTEQVDIIIAYDLNGKQTKRIALANAVVEVLDVQALIEMKKASGRPQDAEDVRALERLL